MDPSISEPRFSDSSSKIDRFSIFLFRNLEIMKNTLVFLFVKHVNVRIFGQISNLNAKIVIHSFKINDLWISITGLGQYDYSESEKINYCLKINSLQFL